MRRRSNGRPESTFACTLETFPGVAALVLCLLLAPGSVMRAGTAEQVGDNRPEAWAMFYFTSATTFTGFASSGAVFGAA